MPIDLLLHSAGQVLTIPGGPQRGSRLGDLGLRTGAAIAVDQGRVVEVGEQAALLANYEARQQVDCAGGVVLPGLVDSHSHALWAGDRAAEFEMRLQGLSYMDILASGGGIMATVRETREASPERLLSETRPRLTGMLRHGSTTVEIKTGYGLEVGAELRMLEAILALESPDLPALVPTFLGAHAVPEEFSGRTGAYVDLVCSQMLPLAASWWAQHAPGRSLPFVDVFCEEGVFDLAQSRRILEAGRHLGFPLKIHADEFVSLGGADLAVELGATSADHLLHTPLDQIRRLARSETVAVALPGTPFGLNDTARLPVRELLEADGLLAVASDLNPGTAWCESLQFTIALACRHLGLTPAQAICAATINGAAALGLQDRKGSLGARDGGRPARPRRARLPPSGLPLWHESGIPGDSGRTPAHLTVSSEGQWRFCKTRA